jgi:putative ABC transport system ATP-binding protein
VTDPGRPLLETRDVCRYYDGGRVRALDGVSVIIPGGAFTLVAGPSGSGKSTLLALLGALDRPTRGCVVFGDRDLTTYSDIGLARVRRQIGFVAQGFALIPRLSASENVAYALIPRGIRRSERRRQAADLLARLGLGTRVAARSQNLSGGEQQRVAIARALVGRPSVVLADEPTSQLDDLTAAPVIELLTEAHRSGATVVVASHDSRLAGLATAALTLAAGRLVTGAASS